MKTRKIVYTLIMLMAVTLLSVIGVSAHGNSNVNVDNTQYQFSGYGRTSTVRVPGEDGVRIISIAYTPTTPGARLNAQNMPYTVGEYIVTVTYELRCRSCDNWECSCCYCAHDCNCGENCDCDNHLRCSYDCDCNLADSDNCCCGYCDYGCACNCRTTGICTCNLPDNDNCCCGYCDYGCDCNCRTTGICTCNLPDNDNCCCGYCDYGCDCNCRTTGDCDCNETYTYIEMHRAIPATGDDRVFPITEILRAVIMLLIGVGILMLLHGGKGKKRRTSKKLAGLVLLIASASFFVPGIAAGTNGNHSINTAAGSVTITPAPLTLIVTLEDKIFDGTTDINIIDVELVGILGDHRVAVVYNPVAQLDQAEVGENIAVTFDKFRLSGEDAFNYYLHQPHQRGTVLGSGANDGNCGCDCTMPRDNDCDYENCTCADDCTCNDITVSINPRPLTLDIEFADKIYNRDTDVDIISYELLTLAPGFDDVHIELHGNVWLADCCVADDVDVIFNYLYLAGTDIANYILVQPYGKTASILPRPITLTIDIVTQREFIRFYNGAEVLGAEIVGGILPGDEPYVSVGTVDGIRAVHTPYDTNGSALVGDTTIAVDIDGYFSLAGERAHNYTVIISYPTYGRIMPGLLPGQVTIHNRDSRLRIGSMLYFTNDLPFFTPANFTREWYLDGELIRSDPAGTPLRDFNITSAHADAQISLRLVNHDEQYEVWGYVQGTASRYTDYIPYTIVIDNVQSAAVAGVPELGAPRPGDRVFFAPGTVANSMMVAHNIASTCPTTGTRTTYASSHSTRNFVDIRWDINHLTNGLSSIYFDNPDAPNTRNVETTLINQHTRYNINPADAIDGVISINATFIHRGVNLGVADHVFPAVNCGFAPPSHTLTVTNTGNAPTNAITVSRTNPAQYNISSATIPSLPIGGSTSITVSPVAGQFANAPGVTEDAIGTRTITSTVTITGADIIARTAHYSMTINHSLPTWAGQHGTASHCQRRCTHAACNALHEMTHTPWSWSAWGHGTATHHTRSRACTRCSRADSEQAAHDENTMGAWSNHNATHHVRTRHCATCARFMRNELGEHTWPTAWSTIIAETCTSAGTQRQECSTAGCNHARTRAHPAALGHSMSGWSQTSPATCTAAGTQTRNCTRCGGNTETQRTPGALGHDPVSSGNYPPTCVSGGRSGRRVCSRCNVVTHAGTVGSPLGHNMQWFYVGSRHCNYRCARPGCGHGMGVTTACALILNDTGFWVCSRCGENHGIDPFYLEIDPMDLPEELLPE